MDNPTYSYSSHQWYVGVGPGGYSTLFAVIVPLNFTEEMLELEVISACASVLMLWNAFHEEQDWSY